MEKKPVRCAIFACCLLVLSGIATAGPPPKPGAGTTAGPAYDQNPEWWTAVRKELEAAEYRVSRHEAGGWQAPNRAQGFRTTFGEAGISVVPREGSAWNWSLSLAAIRRGESSVSPARPRVTVDGNHVELLRGDVAEWYVNAANGLEQGFTFARRLVDLQGRGPLVIAMSIGGDLRPELAEDSGSIDFLDANGVRTVHYGGLSVTDARGDAVAARFELGTGATREVRIVVDDRDASYPLTVDPLATSAAWSAEGNQVLANFGWTVSTAGDVNGDGYSDVIVGAPRYDDGHIDEGRVFVFHGSPGGLGTTASWTAESNQAVAYFGSSVAAAGDVNGDGFGDVIVGAKNFDATTTDDGAVFVFLGSATGLARGTRTTGTPANADWTAAGAQSGSLFGSSVAGAGDVNGDGFSDVIVGAPGFDDVQKDEGRAFVYLGSASGLGSSAAWFADSHQDSAAFGGSVASAGDVNADGFSDVIVGAEGFTAGEIAEGRVSVYYGSPVGPAAEASWTARGEQVVAGFGGSVASCGDVNGDGYADVVVGAHLFDSGQADEGAAFVFYGSATGLDSNGSRPEGSPATADWRAESDQALAEFGVVVSTAGDVNGDGYADLLVGAKSYANGEAGEGAAFVFFGAAGGLARGGARSVGYPSNADWHAEGDQVSSEFGASASAAGDVNGDGFGDIIVGAPRHDDPETDEGRAFVYLGSAAGPSATPGWVVNGYQGSMLLGFSVAGAGDVNGDGYADVIVGAPYYDYNQYDEGLALVYLGGPAGLSTVAAWSATGNQYSANFGYSVAGAGDVNGDGYADVIVGAPNYDNGQGDEGQALVYLGSPAGLSTTPSWTVESNRDYANFGWSVAGAGDVNGDGYADVIIGAPRYTYDTYHQGRAFLYAGSAAGLAATPSWIDQGTQYEGQYGYSVASAGDVNGDGYSDVAVGAPYHDYYTGDGGRVYVYNGSAAGLPPSASWTADGNWSYEHLGWSVASAGDLNGDGFSDLVAGAPESDWLCYRCGRAAIWFGSASGLPAAVSVNLGVYRSSSYFGNAVASAGDVNGDGISDLVVGAQYDGEYCGQSGKAYLYLGSPAGPSADPQWTTRGEQCNEYRGASVAGAGDVNGDGYADVLVGAHGFDINYGDAGRATLWYGNGAPGLALTPRQRRADDSAPIAPLGWSDRKDGFRLALSGRSAFGPGKVRMEWEVKPVGSVFNGLGTATSAWATAGPAAASFDELVTGLPESTAYHWRARLLFDGVTTPSQHHTRWISGAWNGAQEADLALPRSAALALTMTDDPDPYVIHFHTAGITYTLHVSNSGPDQASVSIDDTLPPGTTFVSASPSQGSCTLSAGTVTCNMGVVPVGGSASVAIVVTPASPGSYTNRASLRTSFIDPDPSDNLAQETTRVVNAAIGDRVWEDLNGNGIQEPNEPGVVSALVYLFDGATGAFLDVTFTNANGQYSFANVHGGTSYRVRFIPPPGYTLSPPAQGANGALDSDADPLTGDTAVFSITGATDGSWWDAGVVPSVPCVAPDETIYVYGMRLTTDGNYFPVLDFMDPNQPDQVSGYNVYRSSDPARPHAEWPLVASDVVDMDASQPNRQWVDTTGAVSPTGIWYYHVIAYNHRCPAEGPW